MSKEKRALVMYADYHGLIPEIERSCIHKAVINGSRIVKHNGSDPEPISDVFIIGNENIYIDLYYEKMMNRFTLLDPKVLINHVKSIVGVDPKPNHCADYLAYNGSYVLSLYGYEGYKTVKIDTDYFITSRFMLRNIYDIDESFVILDEGFIPKYGKIPQHFPNANVTYTTSPDDKIISDEVFKSSVMEYYKNNHYTASGPWILGLTRGKYNESTIVPWTLDPTTLDQGMYHVEFKSGTLGYHFQSSVVRSLGLEITEINSYDKYIDYKVALNEFRHH